MADMVLPPPAPQSDVEGLRAGKMITPIPGVSMGSIPAPKPSPEVTRVHGNVTTHPETNKFTRSPTIKTKY